MSDEESITVDTADTQMLTAEYKDGQLQIVEVSPFDKMEVMDRGSDMHETHILPDIINSSSEAHKYVQVLDTDKGLVQLDLLNLTLVRCEDGQESYRLVTNSESDGSEIPSDATVTCVLQSSDGEGDQDNHESYVMVEGDPSSLVFLQSSIQNNVQENPEPPKKALSPTEILERAKQLQKLQKTKALMTLSQSPSKPNKRGRKRKGDLPPPHELLSSPNFKLFLYSCKQCTFKCNAIKELKAHKISEHSSGGKFRSGGASAGRGSSITLQCARCPYRGGTHTQLMKHVHEKHLPDGDKNSNKISLDTKEVAEADVLVCGACGFESSSRHAFRQHIEDEHGAATV